MAKQIKYATNQDLRAEHKLYLLINNNSTTLLQIKYYTFKIFIKLILFYADPLLDHQRLLKLREKNLN